VAKAFGVPAESIDPAVTPATDPRFGHYQCNAAMGLARQLKQKPRDVAARIVEHLETGGLCLPPEIAGPGFINLTLAPEYLTSALRPDVRSDIFSLGAVLFEMLAGQTPYRAINLVELAEEHRRAAPADLARLAPHVPREVVRLLRRMIAREPLRRPQSPRELIEQLIALEVATFTHRPW
jgi:hypothetical protein